MSNKPTPTKKKSLREQILTNAQIKKKLLSFHGVDIELRQPTLRSLIATQNQLEGTDNSQLLAAAVIENSYDPKTGEKVFEDSDLETLLDLGYDAELSTIIEVMSAFINPQTPDKVKN